MKSHEEVNAARSIQGFFLGYRFDYTKLAFEQDIKKLESADHQELKEGLLDSLIAKCLRYCSLHQDRFSLHKFICAIFSGREDALFAYINKKRRILTYLLYDAKSEFETLINVLKDTINIWKSEGMSYSVPPERFRFMSELRQLYSKVDDAPDILTKEMLIQILDDKRWIFGDTTLCSIAKTLAKYISHDSPILLDFLNLKSSIESIVNSENPDSNKVISANVIKKVLEQIWDEVLSNNEFGIVPVKELYSHWGSPDCPHQVIHASHGGGLFFLSAFLQKKNKGYCISTEAGGFGLYVDPANKSYGDNYYALRSPAMYFDIPVALKFDVEAQSLQGTNREYEAVLRHTHRGKIHITDITFIHGRPSTLPIVRPDILDQYPGEENNVTRLHICQTVVRFQKDDKAWQRQLEIEQTACEKYGLLRI